MNAPPILAECEREPRIAEVLMAESAAVSSLAHLRRGPVLIDSGEPCTMWLRTTIAPPLEQDIELLIKRHVEDVVVTGWASRRFLNGAVTFWVWHNGRCRCVRPVGWRAKA